MPHQSLSQSKRVLKAAALIAFSRALTQQELDAAREKSGSTSVQVSITASDVRAARALLSGS